MQAEEKELITCRAATGQSIGITTAASTWDENSVADAWVADRQLIDTVAVRNLLPDTVNQKNLAANALASGRRTIRLLWIALIVSLIAHLLIPICMVTVMMRPEKVALMDGTESLIISPLVPVEESKELLETVSFWAAKSFLDRGPQDLSAQIRQPSHSQVFKLRSEQIVILLLTLY